MLETTCNRLAFRAHAKVPFARHISIVAGVLKQRRKGDDAIVQPGFIARLAFLIVGHYFLHVTHTNKVVGNARHEHSTRRRAGGRYMKVGKLHAGSGQGIYVGCTYLATVSARITKPHIVGNNQQNIGSRLGNSG